MRLFFDIETSVPVLATFSMGYNTSVNANDIIHPSKVVCISYKFQGGKIRTLKWDNGCDKKLIKDFIKIASKSTEMIAHNGDRFDIKIIQQRALFHKIETFPDFVTIDTLKQSRKIRLPSYRLDYIAKHFGLTRKINHSGKSMWDEITLPVIFGFNFVDGYGKKYTKKLYKEALKEMCYYCEGDIETLEEVYNLLVPIIKEKVHRGFEVNGNKWSCPHCASENVVVSCTKYTSTGAKRHQMKCKSCYKMYTISDAVRNKYDKHVRI